MLKKIYFFGEGGRPRNGVGIMLTFEREIGKEREREREREIGKERKNEYKEK